MTTRILRGHVLDRLAELPSESVHCCVTSPPYWGLRDYKIEPQVWGGDAGCEHEWGGLECTKKSDRKPRDDGFMSHDKLSASEFAQGGSPLNGGTFCLRCGAWRGSLGLEPTVELYVEHIVTVFREVRRVLRADGTLWLNLGDAYAGGGHGNGGSYAADRANWRYIPHRSGQRVAVIGLKPKDLIGMPWRVAFVLQADGWWLRSKITWAKRAPMPESVNDRPTSATEEVFLMTKSAHYFYDQDAVKEESIDDIGVSRGGSLSRFGRDEDLISANAHRGDREYSSSGKRNMRNWWLLGPEPFPEAHFATFPTEIPRRAILAGTSAKGCCPKCGAGWMRVVASESRPNTINGKLAEIGGRPHRNPGGGVGNDRRATEFLGWRPSCSCHAGNPVPATCLDPFLGSGTTALVADRLGRDCIGIELSPAYVEMAKGRLAEDAGMFAEIAAE